MGCVGLVGCIGLSWVGCVGLGGLYRVRWLRMVELGLNWIVFLTIAHADSTLSLYLIKRYITFTPVI